MFILDCIQKINRHYLTCVTNESTFMISFEDFLSISPTVDVTNKPNDVTNCSNSDYLLMHGKTSSDYNEANDLGKDLDA